ncbi:MAG: hypothetical protein ABEK59_03460 [Halobacteria archaeon]
MGSLRDQLRKILELPFDTTSQKIALFYAIGSVIEAFRLTMMMAGDLDKKLFSELFTAAIMNVATVPASFVTKSFDFPWWVWLNLVVMWTGILYMVTKAYSYRSHSLDDGEEKVIDVMFHNRLRSFYFLAAVIPIAFYFHLPFVDAIKLWWLIDFWFFAIPAILFTNLFDFAGVYIWGFIGLMWLGRMLEKRITVKLEIDD